MKYEIIHADGTEEKNILIVDFQHDSKSAEPCIQLLLSCYVNSLDLIFFLSYSLFGLHASNIYMACNISFK
jgi:hypothetical protein